MSQFKLFAAAIAAQFAAMSTGELHRAAVEGDTLWDTYLKSFPEGTNPIYRVRTKHDGSYDRSVIRKIGNVIRINDDGTTTTLWSNHADLPYPYNVVAERMDEIVRNADIDSLFRISEQTVGLVRNVENKDGVLTEFHHFHAKIDARHYTKKVGEIVGNENTTFMVMRRGFEEIPASVVADVRELIENGTLYRGAEFLEQLKKFQTGQRLYLKQTSDRQRSIILWLNTRMGAARLRNTAIGTLLVNLAEGMDLEKAVRAYETIMAPANYKRPKALITQGMIDSAMDTIDTMGLRDSLERRFAVISDISVNDVLWVDNSEQAQMRDGLRDLLAGATKPVQVSDDKAMPIDIIEFMRDVAPTAASMELFFGNKHRGNLMSLTAPVHADAPGLFKWDNGFAWSYAGNIADSEMRAAVKAAGGRVDGVFRFTHSWNHDGRRNASLMDLHVFMPGASKVLPCKPNDVYGSGRRVGWNNRNDRASGGVQDVDYTPAAAAGYVPVENITFPDLAKMPDGVYQCGVHNWSLRPPTQAGFKAEIEFGGQVFEYDYPQPMANKEWVHVANVTKRGNEFTIEHKLPHGASSQDIWGLSTERFVKVRTLVNSPNYWGDQATGNKHWFFILDQCQNPDPARGIYNEFLKPQLEAHRKVFEVLGDKTKCLPSKDQLSGLGFSATKRDSVVVKVTAGASTRLYNINF